MPLEQPTIYFELPTKKAIDEQMEYNSAAAHCRNQGQTIWPDEMDPEFQAADGLFAMFKEQGGSALIK